MAGNTLDLVQKLIRLATNNPNEQEAMRAALKACRLVVEHKVVLSLGGAPERPSGPAPRAWSRSQVWEAMKQREADLRRRVQEEQARWDEERKAAEAETLRQKWDAGGTIGQHSWSPLNMLCIKCGMSIQAYQLGGGGCVVEPKVRVS